MDCANETLPVAPVLDLSGLSCPLPVLKTKAALARLHPGDILEVIATHPDSVREFRALCRDPGLELLSFREMDGTFRYVIKKLY